MTLTLAPRFPVVDIPDWALRYAYLPRTTRRLEEVVGPRSRIAGYLTRPDFVDICDWKSMRHRRRHAANSGELIEEATRLALAARDERIRIGVLRLLDGVSWPTASTLLHFAHRDPYPILDGRALWSLGVVVPPAAYDFDLWWAYVIACRRISRGAGVSIRQLDRALWQYSKEHQRVLAPSQR